tara:strand:- start:1637 stop:2317 length:681 start_codon:yes stop_codon:yes gene_type:complete
MYAVLNSKYIAASQHFTEKDSSRPYTEGIYIEPHPSGGVYIVATNGAALSVFYDAEGSADKDVLVSLNKNFLAEIRKQEEAVVVLEGEPGNSAATLVRKIKAGGLNDYLDVAERGAKHPNWITAIGDVFMDWSFPAWRRVIPRPAEKQPQSFSVQKKVFDMFFKAFGELGLKGVDNHVCLHQSEASGAILVRTEQVPEFLGVAMPVNFNPSFMPDWLESSHELQAA